MRKILISFLALLIMTVTVINPSISHADAPKLELVPKGQLGERVLIAVGEKAGVKFANKEAYEKAVERWNMELYEQQLKAEKEGNLEKVADLKVLQGGLKDLKPVDVNPGKIDGFGRYVMDASMYLMVLTLFMDVVTSIENAIVNEEFLEIAEEYNDKIVDGEAFTQIGPYSFITNNTYYGDGNSNNKTTVNFGNRQAFDMYLAGTHPIFTWTWTNVINNAAYQSNPVVVVTDVTDNNYTVEGTYIDRVGNLEELHKTFFMLPIDDVVSALELAELYNKSMWLPNPSDLPSSPSVPWVSPWRDNPDTNKPVLPDEIPLEIPLSDPDIYSPNQPWNEPMPTYDPVPGDQPDKDYIPGVPISPNPDPGTNPNPDTGGDTNPDTGGDTNPDPGGETNPDPGSQPDPGGETNPNPDPGSGNPGTPGTEPPTEVPNGPPQNTNPLSWIWIFITFLFAVIRFILRLGSFIMILPFIPAQQFPGVYGEMVTTFMNLNYANIYPYKIMIALASLSFGFVVYKILRRVFNG